jgi:hypothetical protein
MIKSKMVVLIGREKAAMSVGWMLQSAAVAMMDENERES